MTASEVTSRNRFGSATPNRENIRKWVDALRSGDYQQATGANYVTEYRDAISGKVTPAAYCCLGVACDVAEKSGLQIDIIDEKGDASYLWRSDGCLPQSVMDWLGVDSVNPRVSDDHVKYDFGDEEGHYLFEGVNATTANDSLRWDFGKIADAIEKKYLAE